MRLRTEISDGEAGRIEKPPLLYKNDVWMRATTSRYGTAKLDTRFVDQLEDNRPCSNTHAFHAYA